MLKENKGITLVALVITIIVMLILAGVSISLVVGDNGVLTNATNSADATNVSTVQEAIQMAFTGAQTTWYTTYYSGGTTSTCANWLSWGLVYDNLDSNTYKTLTVGSDAVASTTTTLVADGTTFTVVYNGHTYTGTVAVANTSDNKGATYTVTITSYT